MVMLSFHNPPLYQAGSLGVRAIMLPWVTPGVTSAKMPLPAPTDFRMSFSGKYHTAFDQSTGGS